MTPIPFIISFIIVFIIYSLSCQVIYSNTHAKINWYFFLLGMCICLWIISNLIADTFYNYAVSLFFARIAIVWTVFLPIIFNELVKNLYFIDDKKHEHWHRILLFGSLVFVNLIVYLSQSNLNIKYITPREWGVDISEGIFYYFLLAYLIITFGFSFYNLYGTYRINKGYRQHQAKLILIGSLITVIMSIFTDIILPTRGYHIAMIFGPLTLVFFIFSICIAIFKYNLFTVKIILMEIVIGALWVVILMHIFLAKTTHEILIESGIFIVIVILGILLIQSVLQGIKQREEIKTLAANIEKYMKYIGGNNG